MTYEQAERLVNRLKNACTFHRFEESGVNAEYIRFLMKHDHDRMSEAIDAAIEEDSRNVPAISVLAKKYRDTTKRSKLVQNEDYCDVCDDKGFVLMKRKQPDTGLIYEFVLYCPFCPVGRTWAYDGRNISNKKHRSPYYIPPITKYFGDEGIQALRETNLKRRAERSEPARLAKKELQDVGKSIPDGWQYDTDDVPF